MGVSLDYEFKFSRCPDRLKDEFVEIITSAGLEYKAIVVDKADMNAPALKGHPHQLYCELVRRLLYDNNPPLEQAVLTIDEAVAKIHHHEFNSVLKNYLSKKIVKKIRQVRSRSDAMVQAADFIAGAIYRKYEKGEGDYYNMVQNCEKILIEF